jgi:2-methylisocitrate lyase-like PEP mutase family enzyme
MSEAIDPEKAARFRALHHAAEVLVLPNAWDAMSAAIIAARGARAVATTSGGVAWAAGCADGEHLTRAAAAEAIRRITSVVEVPVSADIEAGYGQTPEDVATTVEAIIAAGAVGINIEDAPGPGSPLFDVAEQVRRIAAARQAGERAGIRLVINARTDVYKPGASPFPEPLEEVLTRAARYAEAGADCVFVPWLLDLDTIRTLVARSPLPVNIMAGPGAPTVAELAAAGVRRISVGTAIAQAAYGLVDRAASELFTHGTYRALEGGMPYAGLNALVRR